MAEMIAISGTTMAVCGVLQGYLDWFNKMQGDNDVTNALYKMTNELRSLDPLYDFSHAKLGTSVYRYVKRTGPYTAKRGIALITLIRGQLISGEVPALPLLQ